VPSVLVALIAALLTRKTVKKNVTVPVKVGIFHVYYQGQSEDIKPFPDDYSIVGGDPTLTEQRIRDENINTRVYWVRSCHVTSLY
jgi:hypothetical protein